jgi:hypothetical protein
MATRQEAKVGTFFLSVVSAALLTFAVTRLFSLMRWTPAAQVCFGIGIVVFVLNILNLALED